MVLSLLQSIKKLQSRQQALEFSWIVLQAEVKQNWGPTNRRHKRLDKWQIPQCEHTKWVYFYSRFVINIKWDWKRCNRDLGCRWVNANCLHSCVGAGAIGPTLAAAQGCQPKVLLCCLCASPTELVQEWFWSEGGWKRGRNWTGQGGSMDGPAQVEGWGWDAAIRPHPSLHPRAAVSSALHLLYRLV